MISRFILFNSSLLLLIFGCSGSKNKNSNLTEKINTKEILCFRNEYAHRNDSMTKDFLELNLSIKGTEVTGTYNWIPAEKDKRNGNLKGTFENNSIVALYQFSQEGVNDTATIDISLKENMAIIKGGRPELGLNATLKQFDCD